MNQDQTIVEISTQQDLECWELHCSGVGHHNYGDEICDWVITGELGGEIQVARK